MSEVSIPPPPENKPPKEKPRRRWVRLAAVAAMTSALVACSANNNEDKDPAPTKAPAVEQEYANLPTVEQRLTELKNAGYTGETSSDISLNSISSHLEYGQNANYTYPKGIKEGVEIDLGRIESTPLMEISRAADGSLRLQEDAADYMDPESTYALLAPIVKSPVVQAATRAKKIDKIVIRLNKTNTKPEFDYADKFYPEFVPDYLTDGKQQNALMLFLPPGSLDKVEYNDATSHEGIHAVLEGNELSFTSENTPSPEKLSQWQNICTKIRTSAIDESEEESYYMTSMMDANQELFTDPRVRAAFNEVKEALEQGSFNRFQTSTPDTQQVFHAKIPECQTLGPWESFLRLLEKRGLNIESDPNANSEAMYDLRADMIDDWTDIVESSAIYHSLKESTYGSNDGYNESKLGHPEYTWDELITSTINNILNHPDKFGTVVKSLSPEEIKTVEQLCAAAVHTFDLAIPRDHDEKEDNKYMGLRVNLHHNYGKVKLALAA